MVKKQNIRKRESNVYCKLWNVLRDIEVRSSADSVGKCQMKKDWTVGQVKRQCTSDG